MFTFHVSPLITLMSSSDKFLLKAFIFLLPWPGMIWDKWTGRRHGIQLHQQTHKLLTHSIFPLQWLFLPRFPGNNVPLECLQTVSSCRPFLFALLSLFSLSFYFPLFFSISFTLPSLIEVGPPCTSLDVSLRESRSRRREFMWRHRHKICIFPLLDKDAVLQVMHLL